VSFKLLRQPGIVLHVLQIKEADLLVTLLSKDLGKICGVAKHARRSKKRFSGGLDLFDCGIFELLSPKGLSDLYHISSFNGKMSWESVRTNLTKFYLASFCLELTNIFTAQDDADNGQLFLPLYYSLRKLQLSENRDEHLCTCIFFNLSLLDICGYYPCGDHFELEKPLKDWWGQMKQLNKPTIPTDTKLFNASLSVLVNYNEQIVGKKLQTGPLIWSAIPKS